MRRHTSQRRRIAAMRKRAREKHFLICYQEMRIDVIERRTRERRRAQSERRPRPPAEHQRTACFRFPFFFRAMCKAIRVEVIYVLRVGSNAACNQRLSRVAQEFHIFSLTAGCSKHAYLIFDRFLRRRLLRCEFFFFFVKKIIRIKHDKRRRAPIELPLLVCCLPLPDGAASVAFSTRANGSAERTRLKNKKSDDKCAKWNDKVYRSGQRCKIRTDVA